MNDDTDKPLNPVGDDALEARLTAWVLGEASPFEAAELEELCAGNPEARLFTQRLRVLHGLIAADVKAGPDDEWKLPAEKRAKIEALFGEPAVEAQPDPEPEKIVSIRRTGRRALMALAACTVISVAGWALLSTAGHDAMPSVAMKSQYEAPAKEVEFVPGGGAGGGWGGGVGLEAPASPTALAAKPAALAEPSAENEKLPEQSVQLSWTPSNDSAEPSGYRFHRGNVPERAKRAEQAGRADSLAGNVSGGMRSGDGAIDRNSIDAILNNPARAKDSPDPSAVPADGFADGRNFSNLGEMAELSESVDAGRPRQSDSYHLALGATGTPDVALGIESLDDLGRKESELGRPLDANAAGTRLWSSQDEGVKSESGAAALMDSPGEAPGYSGLAQKEMIRRQNAVATSDKLRDEGKEAYSKGDYKVAVDRFRESLDVLPDAEMVQDRRDDLSSLFADGATALGEQYRKVGKYDEARQLADDALAIDKDSANPKKLAGALDDARTSVPLTEAHARNVEEVRRKLYTAEGNYNLGKFDDAHKAYEDALRIDPYNKAARRGMEQVALARQDYYRAAYDQTRAQLLADVDSDWELSVPPQGTPARAVTGKALPVDNREAIMPELEMALNARFGSTKGLTEDRNPKSIAESFVRLNQEKVYLEQQLATLSKFGGIQRIQYASGLTIPDNIVPVLLPQLQEAKRDLERLRASGMGPEHPAMKSAAGMVAVMEADLGEATDNLRETLQAKLAMLKGEVTEVESKLDPEIITEFSKFIIPTPESSDPVAELATETATTAEPFSTFSLHVSDASFKLAQAALERGEVPAAESIRPEEFYNAFDYGDPAPGHGEPVACAVEQSAHPAIPQRNLLRIGVKTGSQGRGGSTPLNLTLLLDSSGSMEREDRQVGLANAVRQLSGLLKEGDTISVIGFARQPRLLADRLPGARAQELNAILARTPSEGGTNLEEGLKLGEELALRQFNPAAQNRIVLFTDGAANLGDSLPETLQAKVEQMRQQGIAFDAAGFGADGLNDQLLERLTRNGNGRYYIVDDAADADANFAKQLAGAFRPAAENVKVQVRFNPARVAKYKLIGFEEHRLNKEDFRNDAVDAAEMAAEEVGNALYQIEALPQGEGEVGEVSVRFRDAASGQMVERTWTIPYEAQAPAFDQAKPSLQLAGLAAFAAEKLRAAPLADAVDFQQLAPVLAKVKARYPNSRPVAELEAMIGRLK